MTVPETPFHLPVAAIDIGYFSTKIACRDSDNNITTFSFPSQCARVTHHQIISAGMTALSGVNVKVGDGEYFVGPDSALHAKGRESRSISDNFVFTEEYRALFIGALNYVLRNHIKAIRGKKEVIIQRVVVGLPLNTFVELRQKVREMFEGHHTVPSPDNSGDLNVTVKSVTVLPQPQGAMVSSGAKLPIAEMKDYYSQNILVIDMGGGTCDWLMCNDRRAVVARCGAYQKGVIACVYAICDSLNKNFRDDPLVVQRIDDALRDGKESFKLSGRQYMVADVMPHAVPILHECLNSVLSSVSSLSSVDCIIFTGGGGKLLYKEALNLWPDYRQVMQVDEEPVTANVTGFLLSGEMMNA